MALRWLVHAACHVLGYPHETNMHEGPHHLGYPNHEQHANGVVDLKRSSKATSNVEIKKEMYPSGFEMPLHYPRYSKADYEKMEEWKIDMLLRQYGLSFKGTLEEKRNYAMGAFLWPDQY